MDKEFDEASKNGTLKEYLDKKYKKPKLPAFLCSNHDFDITVSDNGGDYDIIRAECKLCTLIKTRVRYKNNKEDFIWDL